MAGLLRSAMGKGSAACVGGAAGVRAGGACGIGVLRPAAFALVAFALMASLLLVAPCAFADEPAEGSNAVDTAQLPDSSFIYDTSIPDLSTADTYYDRQTVQVTGEVIGDTIEAGADDRHCWITLSSTGGASSVSVYMTDEAAAKIDSFGKYNVKGTTLQVRGTFHLACSEHDGASDIHAQVVTVTERGKAMPDAFDAWSFVPGVVAVVIGLALMAVFYVLRERQR